MNLIQHNTTLNSNSRLPNMSETIKSWFQDVSFEVVTRVLDDEGNGVDWNVDSEETVTINTQGVIMPASDKDLKILPEGTWAWEWQKLYCLPDVVLNTNNFIIYKNVRYKVMKNKDYSEYGYVRYILLEAFKAEELENVQ